MFEYLYANISLHWMLFSERNYLSLTWRANGITYHRRGERTKLIVVVFLVETEQGGGCRLRIARGTSSKRRSSHQLQHATPAMVLLELDPFLNELTKLYEQTKQSGTVWVTLKRSTLQRQKKRKINAETSGKTNAEAPASVPESSEYRCLVRATDGKKKISCSLTAKDHQRFQTSYATVLKAHMDSLKKKEKKDKREKKTAAAKAPVS